MRSHKTLARVCAAAALISTAQVQGQQLALSEQGASAKSDGKHPRGSYTGVKPGGDEAPAARAKAGTNPPAITWPGFQMRSDGSSRVFVQTTSQVDVSAALVDGKVVVDFGNVTIPNANNRLPLITKFFNTPVTLVEVKRAKKRTTLVLTMRTPVEPRVSHEQASSGFHFVYVDFPPGAYLPSEAPSTPPAAPLPAPNLPDPEAASTPAPATRTAPGHLDGNVGASGRAAASGRASASADAELPPGMGKTKATAGARGEAKAGGSFKIGK
jgi:hypothetical protein